MRDGHLVKRAGREFARNLLWMAVVLGSLAAILVAATDLPLAGVMFFVGVFAAVMAAIVTVVVIWSGAYDETKRHRDPGSPADRGGWEDLEKWTGHSGGGGGGGS